MKRIILTLTLALFVHLLAKAQQPNSSLNTFISQNPDLVLFHSIDNHHYFVKNEQMTWTEARDYGDQIGVSMYIINNANEQNEVFTNLPSNTGYWLGLYQDNNDSNFSEPNGGWKWVDGSDLIYTDWYNNEPNNVGGGEDYAEFNDGQGIRWNDVPNDNGGNLNIPIYEFVSFGDILLNGTVSAENYQIKNVADPTEAQDVTTKSYVENIVSNTYTQSEVDAIISEAIAGLQDQIDALQASSGSGTVTDQDGNSYPYLTYGNQVWTVKNAEVVTYRDGTPIPRVSSYTEWRDLETGAWCYYDNDPTKGKLYNWYALMGIHNNDENTPNKEFAPEGWHVPTDAEWTTLENYLISNGYNYDGTTSGNKIAKAMASTTGWTSSTIDGAIGNNQSLNNSTGFNAIPEGYRAGIGSFTGEGPITIFWSSTQNSTNNAWGRYMNNSYIELNRSNYNKQLGVSVRFVRD